MKKKTYSNFFKYEFWDLNRLFSLSYSSQFHLFHISIENAVRMSSVFDTVHVFRKNEFDGFLGEKFLSAFGKSRKDLIAVDGIHLLQFNEPTLLNKYKTEIKKREPEGLPQNNNGVILKLKFIESSMFNRIFSESKTATSQFVQHDLN